MQTEAIKRKTKEPWEGAAALTSEEIARRTLATILGIVSGGLLGGLFLPQAFEILGHHFGTNLIPNYPRVTGVLIGAALGAALGYGRAVRQARRKRAAQEVARRIGLRPGQEIEPEIVDRVTEMFEGSGRAHLENIASRSIESARVILRALRGEQGIVAKKPHRAADDRLLRIGRVRSPRIRSSV